MNSNSSGGPYCYRDPRPVLTADIVVIGLINAKLHILLIERKWGLFKGMRALPGGCLDYRETAEAAAQRELEEETAVKLKHFIQLQAFSDPDRDPEEYCVTVGFLALVRPEEHEARGGDDAADARWFALDTKPKLAFDHDVIVDAARLKLRMLATLGIAGVDMLPKIFPLPMLQSLHEQILRKRLKHDFCRRFIEDGLIVKVARRNKEKTYRFDRKRCRKLLEQGAV